MLILCILSATDEEESPARTAELYLRLIRLSITVCRRVSKNLTLKKVLLQGCALIFCLKMCSPYKVIDHAGMMFYQ